MTITCADTDCKYNTSGNCTATAIDHTSDRFCSTGRRKPKDEIQSAMRPDVGMCHRSNGKLKRNGG